MKYWIQTRAKRGSKLFSKKKSVNGRCYWFWIIIATDISGIWFTNVLEHEKTHVRQNFKTLFIAQYIQRIWPKIEMRRECEAFVVGYKASHNYSTRQEWDVWIRGMASVGMKNYKFFKRTTEREREECMWSYVKKLGFLDATNS